MMSPEHTDEFEARLTDYLEGELDDADRAEIDALLEDADIRTALEEAREARALLGGLSRPPVPRDFLRKVQRRVRRRSGGRYFHPAVQPFGWRMSVEVFVVVAIAVMAGCWFLLDAGHRAPAPIVDDAPGAIEVPAPEPYPGGRLAPIEPANKTPEDAKAPAATTPYPAGEARPGTEAPNGE